MAHPTAENVCQLVLNEDANGPEYLFSGSDDDSEIDDDQDPILHDSMEGCSQQSVSIETHILDHAHPLDHHYTFCCHRHHSPSPTCLGSHNRGSSRG